MSETGGACARARLARAARPLQSFKSNATSSTYASRALAEECDMTGALANIRRRIRQLQAAVHTNGAQAAAEADGVRQLGPSRWNAGNAGERPRATGWGRIL